MRARQRSTTQAPGGARYTAIGSHPGEPPGSPSRTYRPSAMKRLGQLSLFLVTCLLVGTGVAAPLLNSRFEAPPLHAVQLFKKPDVATGQLIPVKEGLDVLRAQTEPFTIVAAVGPTRTGKSSILGRAFLRGTNENVFETGAGVMSHTGGVWITSQPVTLHTGVGGKGNPVRVFLIDSEGFSGVGGLTSRTYEANLFGILYLLCSTMVFNSMYPVDASMVDRMNSYGKRTLDVIAELNDFDVANKRMQPKLVWSVQSFNMYNLQNSKMSVDQLLSDLKNTSRKAAAGGGAAAGAAGAGAAGGGGPSDLKTGAASAVLGGRAAGVAASSFVLENLFRSVQLVPVRRPHAEDEVVANLGNYPSVKLSDAYLADADTLREAALIDILPAHKCRVSQGVPLFPKRCGTAPFTGSQLVEQLQVWLKYGHVIDPSESEEALNETAALSEFYEEHDAWFERECTKLTKLLQSKLRDAYGGRTMNETGLAHAGAEAQAAVMGFVKHLPRKSMARGIELSTFWQYPSKVATYIESKGKEQTTQCAEDLVQVRRDVEAKQRTMGRAPNAKVAPPRLPGGANGTSAPLKIVRKSDSVTFEMASKQRLSAASSAISVQP